MTSFSDLMHAVQSMDGDYRAHIPEDWQQGRTTFGGMTAALCVAATERLVPDLPPLRSAQFTFMGPVGGEVTIHPRLLRRGRSSAFAAVELCVAGAPGTHALLSFGHARDSLYQYRSQPMPAVPPPATTANFFKAGKPAFVQHFEGFVAGGQRLVSHAAHPELLLWLRHRDPQAMAMLPGLIALGDAPPAAAYTMLSAPVPVSSITWSIELINVAAALAAPGDAWYLLRSTSEDIRDGYSIQNMALWAQDGTLITLARQNVAVFG